LRPSRLLNGSSEYVSGFGEANLKHLNALNSVKPKGLPVESLKPLYESGKNSKPHWYTNYSFDQWFAFLKAWTPVREDDGTARVTVAGEEFLKFLVQTALTMNKEG
jgi:hypothetical protein